MVFESLVSDLLNRFIGDYVENLDKSQLKIGIWGGNVVLENLRVKENALSEFELPLKVKAGQIGTLTLKIPWKNLYNDAVVATLDGLYLLLVPGATIKYDAAKEERYQQEAKQRQLQRIDNALRMAARRASQSGDLLFGLETILYKDTRNVTKGFKKHKKALRKSKRDQEGKSEKVPDEKKDTFVEKLATQVIKNLQVKISSIHLRYEDDVSDPQRPLSVGVTLAELSLQTTDDKWNLCILNEAAKIIYKLGRLECLCAYWNVNSQIFHRGLRQDIVDQLKCGISSKDQELPDHHYIFKPIFASAKIRINPNAEQELDSPRVQLHLEVQNIDIQISKPQYGSMVEMLESVDRMAKNAPYRKFRPDVPVRANAPVWWRYAIGSILELHVRRRSRMWSWSTIRLHRQHVKTYKAAYKSKMLGQNKSGAADLDCRLQDLEKLLDVFNITLARQQAHMEAVRSGQKVASAKKSSEAVQKQAGFFSSFFGRKPKKEEAERDQSKEVEGSALDGIMTAEEKEKLYTAIGYSGSSHNLALPKQYVAVAVSFQLLRTSVTVREHAHVPEILRVQMIHLSTQISQRPGAQALRVEASLQQWSVTGLDDGGGGGAPSLISSAGDSAASLLDVSFQLNPDDSPADHVVRVRSQPVQIIYDAATVNSLAEFFKMGKGVDLEVLTSATLSKLEEIKEKTATGLSHMIETRKVLDLRIDLRPSYLLLPKSGSYSDASELVVVDFGSLQLNSVDEKLRSSPSSSFSSLEEIMERAYERYSVELRRVQVLYSESGEAWKSSRLQNCSGQHILQPLDLTLHLSKCMVDKDARMPRLKLSGELPLVHVKMSDEKIRRVAELLRSIPLPRSASAPATPTHKVLTLAESRSRDLTLHPALLSVAETDSDGSEKSAEDEQHQRRDPEELTDLQFKFEVKEVLLELTRQAEREEPALALALRVCQLGAQGKMRTFDSSVTTYLRTIALDYCRVHDGEPLHLIACSERNHRDLLKVDFIKADPAGPNFRTLFDNTEQTLKVEFSSLDFLLDAKALLSTMDFLSSAVAAPQLPSGRGADARKPADKERGGRTVSKGAKDSDVLSFKLLAVLGCFHVELCDERRSIADIRVQGMDASVQVQAKRTEAFARLRDIVITDVNPECVHKKAVSIVGEEVFSFKLCLFPGATEGDAYGDTSKVDGKVTLRLGCIRMVYLHKFLMSLLMFADKFHTAKEAVSTATAQAASGVRQLASKSFRLSADIRLKAPLVVVPQSSRSQNAVLVDLGLITVSNSFCLVPAHGFSLPAVVDKMDIRLTQLKLSRTTLGGDSSSGPDIAILEPLNVQLAVTRNMAWSWFSNIPAMHVQGVLPSLKVSVGEEDLSVLVKVLLENISEGSRERRHVKDDGAPEKVEFGERQSAAAAAPSSGRASDGAVAESVTNGETGNNTVNILLNFEITEILLSLKKKKAAAAAAAAADGEQAMESPFLVFHLGHLGMDTKVRKYDTCATTYINKMTLTCLEFKDSGGDPLILVSSSAQPGAELLKVQYFKADRDAPNFSSMYKNTEQMINVTFTSLDLMLHTQALLSAANFLSGAVSSGGGMASPDRTLRPKTEDGKMTAAKSHVFASPEPGEVIGLKVMVALGAFNVLVCDQSSNIVDIKIQGLHGSLLTQGPQTHISARLKDFVVLNVDPASIHKKAISIVGDEVFSFSLSLTPSLTEGSGYADTSKTDGRLKLNVGCIQVVYLHKLVMALLNFTNNFQTAKAAVSAATAQAAERAASSVRDLAEKSFRLAVDIGLKAPLIVIPQSSASYQALVMDLGLITVSNAFSLLPVDGRPLPAVIDNMDVQLTQLKLSRNNLEPTSGGSSIELLEPVNLNVRINRNLAASWYNKMAAVEVDGDLKPMKVALSQQDLQVLLKILSENMAEANSLQPSDPRPGTSPQTRVPAGPQTGGAEKQPNMDDDKDESVESIKFNFSIESLGLVLYRDQPTKSSDRESSRLGEFALHLLKASGKLWNNGSMEFGTILTNCTLDDQRTGVDRVTSRMVSRQDCESSEVMIDVVYRQSGGERSVEAVLQKLYVCASVEFLMAVADFFLQALPQRRPQSVGAAPSDRLAMRQAAERKSEAKTACPSRTSVHVVVVDPQVVFVASLMKADAPSLVVAFQCDLSLEDEGGTQTVKAQMRALKVLACPFIHNQEDKTITTVLRPCSVVMETTKAPSQALIGSVTVEEVIVKISPFILNTVSTIMAAMTARQHDGGGKTEEPHEDLKDLWLTKKVYDCNYWFLGVDQASEVTESFRDQEDLDLINVGQQFAAQVKVIQVTLESGLGHRTVPLLLAESSFSGSAKNWSSLLQLKASMTLEVNYFNEVHAVWEPLIERLDGGARRWKLHLEVKSSPVQDKSPVHGDDFVILPEPCTAVNICSGDALNVTLSRCSLNVFSNLAKAFSEGAASTFEPSMKEKAPFTILNALGIPLLVRHSANLRPVGTVQQGKLHELPAQGSLDLEHSVLEPSSRGKLSALQRQESCLFHLTIVASGYSEIANVPVDKPGRRLYNMRGPELQQAVSLVVQIDAADGNKMVTVRSPLQIQNHFSVPFSVLKFCPSARSLQPIGLAHPEKEFHIPLDAYRCQLYVRPASGLSSEYGPSSTCVSWKEEVHRSSEVRSLLQCPPLDGGGGVLPLMVSTLAAPDALNHIGSRGEDDWDPAYVLHLHPVATIRNLLPYTIRYMMENSADSYELSEGSTSDLLNARVRGEIVSLVLLRYQGRDWHGHLRVDRDMPDFLAVRLTCDSDVSAALDLSVHAAPAPGRLLLSVFSPFWIINKTQRVLRYRADDVDLKHPADLRDIVLFSFRRKNILANNKLQLCVSTSSWSDGFSLDAVGSYGCVRCPGNKTDFLVGVSIRMSGFNLTKMVTMSPFYTLVNESSYELEVGEAVGAATKWHYVPSAECLPLWPESASAKLCVRAVGSERASEFFCFDRQDNGTLLNVDACGGIVVDVNVSDHSNVIGFTDYYDGAAPALLVNHTPWVDISYKQSGSSAVHHLKPGEARRFAWDDPAGVRTLSWSCMEHSGETDLLKDEVGQFSYDSLSEVHWVSFLDGRQRVLIFTEDVAVVTKARQAEELEQFQQEVRVSLQNLGLSLVDNLNRQEVAYVGIPSSGVVWEMKRKNRWKPLSQKHINMLEKTYQSVQSGNLPAGWTQVDANLEVNLGGAMMTMRQPFSCPLRRNFLSAIQVELKRSQHQRSLRAQLHWLQVDNQLPGAIFPIAFHPVPPPKSIALDSEPKPFIDVSVITRFNQHSSVTQFKYFMALVQEMAVKIDQGFLSAILALFTPAADPQAKGQKSHLIAKDVEVLQAELMESSLSDASGLNFFEHFHISPIKLHLSLSLGSSGGGERSAQDAAAVQSLNLLLKSIGATLTDVDDLIFKLAYFEVKYQFYRRDKLMRAALRHYSEQFLKQMYVLVLGLDVLGNPFGLIRGLSEGVEAFFYEPFQGAVQGPEEFAEGFVIGVRSLLGHTVGGAAGVVSRITGSVGKGLAAITMDKEYQQKRREEMNRTPKDFGESLAKGGKGLLKGVVSGVTGIVTKPVEGAKKEGAAGFFKGIGKGLVGVVARPTGSIVDMASSTFQGIQRVAESTEDVSKLRPVRLIREDGIIRPYDLTESQGFDLFQRSELKQLEGEVFRDQCPYPGHRKTNVIITNRRVVCVKELDFVGHFNKDWECLFENFSSPPNVSGSRLNIYCKEQHKLKLPRKDAHESTRSVELRDEKTAQRMLASMLDAQAEHQQRRMSRQKSQRFLKAGGKL
ncbi:intermembrane lipid transfer protein VPS13C isoform X2 [Festucalex cinctus]